MLKTQPVMQFLSVWGAIVSGLMADGRLADSARQPIGSRTGNHGEALGCRIYADGPSSMLVRMPRTGLVCATSPCMETKPAIPLAVLVGIQTPDVGDVAHEASLEERGHLVKRLGYGVICTVSQKSESTGARSLLGSAKLTERAALTGGTGVVGSMAQPPKPKARLRFYDADHVPDAAVPDPDAARKPEFVHRRS